MTMTIQGWVVLAVLSGIPLGSERFDSREACVAALAKLPPDAYYCSPKFGLRGDFDPEKIK